MLDAQTTRKDDGTLAFSVYRKSTHTDQYLQFSSHQPLQHKLGVIRTLNHRAETICSDEPSLKKEVSHVKKVLAVSGYTHGAWKQGTQKTTWSGLVVKAMPPQRPYYHPLHQRPY